MINAEKLHDIRVKNADKISKEINQDFKQLLEHGKSKIFAYSKLYDELDGLGLKLSRLQDDEHAFTNLFFKFQRVVAILILPLGVGIFCYSDFITSILGTQWIEAAPFIGLWGLISAITIILSHYSSEVYRAKGRPRLSVLSQFLHIIVLWPTVYIAVKYGFEVLYTARSLVRLEAILVNLIIMYVVVKISPYEMLKNIYRPCISAIIMGLCSYYLLLYSKDIIWQIISIIISVVIYICVLFCFSKERKYLLYLYNKVVKL